MKTPQTKPPHKDITLCPKCGGEGCPNCDNTGVIYPY